MTEIDYSELPDEDELAFVVIERSLRDRLSRQLESNEDSYNAYNSFYIEYINHVVAAAKQLRVEPIANYEVPSNHHANSLVDNYKDFSGRVSSIVMQIQIAHGRRRKAFTVGLTIGEKDKIRSFCAHIKAVIDSAGLPPEKLEELLKKLNRFIKAIDMPRTELEMWAEFALTVAGTASDGANRLNPVVTVLDKIMKILGHRKNAETEQHLPPAEERPKIESPKTGMPSTKSPSPSGLDDDIPF